LKHREIFLRTIFLKQRHFNSYVAINKQQKGAIMKNLLILSMISLMSLPTAANSDDLREIGEDMCYGVINAVSPGTNHVMDCLTFVDELIVSDLMNQESIIEAICAEAPKFSYSMGGISEQECLKSAREEFLK